MNNPTRWKRGVGAVVLTAAMSVALGVVAAPSAAAASAVTVVRFEGNPCFVPRQTLSRWKVFVDGGSTAVLDAGSGRSISFTPPAGSHNYAVQSWCSGPFIGRTSSGNRWTYRTGTSNAVFFAGIHTG